MTSEAKIFELELEILILKSLLKSSYDYVLAHESEETKSLLKEIRNKTDIEPDETEKK